jgi:hypothetical protein
MILLQTTRGGFDETKEKLITAVNVECDDKNYRTMNEVRRNRRSIVAMSFGSK